MPCLIYRELFSINPLIDPLLISRRLQRVFSSPGMEEEMERTKMRLAFSSHSALNEFGRRKLDLNDPPSEMRLLETRDLLRGK